jgi:hypothetical protein
MEHGAASQCATPSGVAPHDPMRDPLVQRGSYVAPQQKAPQLLMPRRAQWRCKKGLVQWNSFAEDLFFKFV